LRTARKPILVALSRHIEAQALNAADPPMVLTALQRAKYFTGKTRRRYMNLAKRSPLVALFGRDLPVELEAGLRGITLDPADPL
jgi:DICT domain-containing protein